MGNVAGLRLQQEQKVAVFLGFLIVGEETFLGVGRIVEVACDFILLGVGVSGRFVRSELNKSYLLKGHSILNQQGNS